MTALEGSSKLHNVKKPCAPVKFRALSAVSELGGMAIRSGSRSKELRIEEEHSNNKKQVTR